MSREQILTDLEDLVLTLAKRSDMIQAHPGFFSKWQEKNKRVQEQVKVLSRRDRRWIDREYHKWFHKEIEPILTPDQRKLMGDIK